MVEVGRVFWRSSGPRALLKQIHLGLVAHNHTQTDFEDLQEERLHNITGQPVPLLGHPQTKKVFTDVQMAHTVFVPTASGPVTGHHQKRAWFCLLRILLSDICTH